MQNNNPVTARYLSTDYLNHNPTWDSEDSAWKAAKVFEILQDNRINPASIVDVGCGAAIVLSELQRTYPVAQLSGFDIAPDAERFWEKPRASGIKLTIGDFTTSPRTICDLLLVLDVLEHLQDPFAFLGNIHGRARHYVFHFPLDLSAVSVLREIPLLRVRQKVGHIHYFTRHLALSLLAECGYEIVDARYTGAAFSAPQRTLKTLLAELPRRAARLAGTDWAIRLFGGETLMVLATSKDGA